MQVVSNDIVSNRSGFRSRLAYSVWTAVARLGTGLGRALHDSRARQSARKIHSYQHLIERDPDAISNLIQLKFQSERVLLATTSHRRHNLFMQAIGSRAAMFQGLLAIASIVFFACLHIVALYKVDAHQQVVNRAPEKIVFGQN